MDTLDTIVHLAAREFAVAPETIATQTPVTELGIDSLSFVEFLFKLEDQFGIRFSDDPAAQPRTLFELAALVDRLRSESRNAALTAG